MRTSLSEQVLFEGENLVMANSPKFWSLNRRPCQLNLRFHNRALVGGTPEDCPPHTRIVIRDRGESPTTTVIAKKISRLLCLPLR